MTYNGSVLAYFSAHESPLDGVRRQSHEVGKQVAEFAVTPQVIRAQQPLSRISGVFRYALLL